jgi:phosphoglycolate phosphatase
VLWDVDYTLVKADGVGIRLYRQALADMYGLELSPLTRSFGGRTDTAIALEVLRLAGVPDPAGQVRPFQAFLRARSGELAAEMREHGVVLPGAAEALAALAVAQGRGEVVQSLLTGNLPELAEVKLATLGLTEHLDLKIGAYGDVSAVRADLVDVARRNAAALHGHDFGGRATVLVGDTPSDVEAALATGASAVGVASGSYDVGELEQAGAHVVFPSLADTDAVVSAIMSVATA